MPAELEHTPASAGRLRGKVAIVTGAASGIGLATATQFIQEGARVVLADRDRERAWSAAAALGPDALPFAVDVTDADQIAAMVEAATEHFGTVDVLYSNAGIAESVKPLAEIGIDEWRLVIDVNLTAFFLCARAVAPQMRAAGGGSIIVTASIAARRPRPGLAAYVASKSGAIGLARALAIELAPDRIRVNVINPGPARTPMLREFGFAGDEEDAVRQLESGLPLGQAIDPQDIAAAAVFLAGDEAAKVTGLVMNVDSGRDL